jgi:hypothetical protein
MNENMMAAHRAERAREKTEAVAVIAHTLAKIEGEGREPDLWEREFMCQAVSWLYRGGYRIAAVNATLALTPEHQRSPVINIKPDPLVESCDIVLLRAAFQEAEAQPLADFPAFGPIVFAPR